VEDSGRLSAVRGRRTNGRRRRGRTRWEHVSRTEIVNYSFVLRRAGVGRLEERRSECRARRGRRKRRHRMGGGGGDPGGQCTRTHGRDARGVAMQRGREKRERERKRERVREGEHIPVSSDR